MGRVKFRIFNWNDVVEFLNYLLNEKPLLPLGIPMLFLLWAIEKWFFCLSNWVALFLAVWVTVQYGSYQHRHVEEDFKKKWMQFALQASSVTPLEPCQWLNKLLMDVWLNFISPRLSSRLQSSIKRRLKLRKSRLVEDIELKEFSLGSHPPVLGLGGIRWASSGDQRVMQLGFDWDSSDVNILMFAKCTVGTAQIIINSIHVKGDLLLMPILDGKGILYSFVSTPEVRIGVAFGSGGSESLPATEFPVISSWLVKIAIDTLNKRMVEPRRQCVALPVKDLQKKAVGGALYVTVISANKICGNNWKGSPATKKINSSGDTHKEENPNTELQTFIEIEFGELTRKTEKRKGSNPEWGSTYNLILDDDVGIVKFNLYKCNTGSLKYEYLSCCEIKLRYVPDDSTIFWAIGAHSAVISKRAEKCGDEVQITVPFEGVNSGELTVSLVLKEWQFSDGSHSSATFGTSTYHPVLGTLSYLSNTGRKIYVTVIEGKDLVMKNKIGKSDPYVKLQYGKSIQKTKCATHSSNPIWNEKFEFDEIGDGEYLQIKCFNEENFSDENIGSARLNLEGLVDGSVRDVSIPLEKVSSGELRLRVEAVNGPREISKSSQASSMNDWIELVLIEARDLVAADLRGTSDPYVRVHYGNMKRTTKVVHKTLNPKWYQTLEFPDNGSPLELHVKDHNILFPERNIGCCFVEYQMLSPNQTADKWIPLQGVTRGEVHIQITRKNPNLEKKPSVDSVSSPIKLHHRISNEMKQMMIKIQSLLDDNSVEEVSRSLTQLEVLHDTQEEYMIQLEMEKKLLLDKISEVEKEMFKSSTSLSTNGEN